MMLQKCPMPNCNHVCEGDSRVKDAEIAVLKQALVNESDWKKELYAQLAEARGALGPLVKKLVEIGEHESYKGIWPFLHVHGYIYTGPMYALELRNAIATLLRLFRDELQRDAASPAAVLEVEE